MPEPRICASIATPNTDGVLRTIAELEPYRPDLIEVRLDYLERMDGLDWVRRATPRPLIATCRRVDQGGLFKGSERHRLETLVRALGEGFDYVDIELATPGVDDVAERLRRLGAGLIVSHHDLRGTPNIGVMRKLLRRGLGLKPEIIKIVGTARSYMDNHAYLRLVGEGGDNGLVSFGMGRAGIPSRVLSPLMGGAFTYASALEGPGCAPGQLSIASMREIYRMMGV